MESRTNKSFDDFNDSGSLEELLAAQRAAVERALAFNQMIAERVVVEVKTSSQMKSKNTEDKKPVQLTKPAYGTDVTQSTLTIPLIGRDQSPIRMNDINTAPESPKSAVSTFSKATSRDLAQTQAKSAMSWFMFPTLEGVKEHVDTALNKEDEDDDHFAKTGFFPRIARHPWFSNATLAVIVGNTLWIAYDTDHNDADLLMQAKIQFQVAGHFFCGFFTVELLIRFLAFKSKWYAILDPWFAFEMFLVGLMIWETWVESLMYLNGYTPKSAGGRSASVLRICRIFRLLRVARTGRVLNAIPELMILAKGMFAGVRSVMVTLTLLALIIYIFAIVFTQLLGGTPFDLENHSNFANVPVSANFLLLQVLAGFDPDFAIKLLAFMPVGYLMLLVYVLLGSLTIMNMLIGILCDVVFQVANDEKEEREEHEMENKLDHLAEDIDASNKGVVSRVDFEAQVYKSSTIQQLSDLGVDVAGLIDFAHFVFQENAELSYKNFEHMVAQFTGSKQASVQDIMMMRKQISVQMSQVLQAYESNHQLTMTVYDKLDNIMTDGVRKRESPVQVKDRTTPQSRVTPMKPSEVNAPSSRPVSRSLTPSLPKNEANAPASGPSSSPSGISRSPGSLISPPKLSSGSSRPPQSGDTNSTPPRRFAYQGSPIASSFRPVEDDSSQPQGSPLAFQRRTSQSLSPSTADYYRKARDTKAAAENLQTTEIGDSLQPQGSPFAVSRVSSTSLSPLTADTYRKTRETKAAAENFAKKYTA